MDFQDLKALSRPERRKFYSEHVFHERQKNSCPIGCLGCAVSASTSNQGSIKFKELMDIYHDAFNLGVRLQITKVEGYDPVFVDYADTSEIPFAQSVSTAVNLGHNIITPVCTTGSWKSERSIWQLRELGELENKFRKYIYPSGNSGEGFVLSVPREIRPFANDRYSFDEHIKKVVFDISLLTVNGNLDVLIYYNSKLESDFDFALQIKQAVEAQLNSDQRSKANLEIADFNTETLPESCMRYENSVLVSDLGFTRLDPVTMDWEIIQPAEQELIAH